MKTSEKKGLLILIVIAILIIGGIWFFKSRNSNKEAKGGNSQGQPQTSASQGEYTKVEANGTIVNTSETLKKERTTESGFKLSNITFKDEGGETKFSALVTNMTGTNQASFYGKIVLSDKAGNKTGEIPVMIAATQAGEVVEIEATITESYANAYDFKLVK